jgi:hypothetical protein
MRRQSEMADAAKIVKPLNERRDHGVPNMRGTDCARTFKKLSRSSVPETSNESLGRSDFGWDVRKCVVHIRHRHPTDFGHLSNRQIMQVDASPENVGGETGTLTRTKSIM